MEILKRIMVSPTAKHSSIFKPIFQSYLLLPFHCPWAILPKLCMLLILQLNKSYLQTFKYILWERISWLHLFPTENKDFGVHMHTHFNLPLLHINCTSETSPVSLWQQLSSSLANNKFNKIFFNTGSFYICRRFTILHFGT